MRTQIQAVRQLHITDSSYLWARNLAESEQGSEVFLKNLASGLLSYLATAFSALRPESLTSPLAALRLQWCRR